MAVPRGSSWPRRRDVPGQTITIIIYPSTPDSTRDLSPASFTCINRFSSPVPSLLHQVAGLENLRWPKFDKDDCSELTQWSRFSKREKGAKIRVKDNHGGFIYFAHFEHCNGHYVSAIRCPGCNSWNLANCPSLRQVLRRWLIAPFLYALPVTTETDILHWHGSFGGNISDCDYTRRSRDSLQRKLALCSERH